MYYFNEYVNWNLTLSGNSQFDHWSNQQSVVPFIIAETSLQWNSEFVLLICSIILDPSCLSILAKYMTNRWITLS